MSQEENVRSRVSEVQEGQHHSERPSSSSRSIIIFGFIAVVAIFVVLGGWSATAPLSKAVAAHASLTVKVGRKSIQHLEGGIVQSIEVSEGEMVNEGDLLVALNPLQANATVARHDAQLDQALAREARLVSELNDSLTIELSGPILTRLTDSEKAIGAVIAEERHLEARRATLDSTLAILKQRIDQLSDEIEGLQIQRKARLEQLKIFQNELIGLRDLYQKGYYPKTKILAMERAIVELRGAAGNDLALISRALSSRGEAENQIISVKQRFREDVVKQLRDVQLEITDLNERLLVAKDVLQRIEIRAPKSGVVQGIQFHTMGGVVRPGEVLMDLAPKDEELIVNARVLPMDIDNVSIGQRAEVRLTALNSRTTPAIYGNVVSVSGDILIQKGAAQPYFLTRIEIPKDEVQKLGDVELSAGMPADVLIQTGERTVLNYLMKPLLDAFARGLNED